MSTIPPLIHGLQVGCEFAGYVRDVFVRVPDVGTDISDVLIALTAGQDRNGTSVDDLRTVWGGQDVTEIVVELLRTALEELAPSELENSYRAAVQSWWSFAGITGDFGAAAADAVRRALSLNAAGIVASIQQLGDREDSCKGNLHVLNYSFSQIPVAPLSMTAVRDRFGSDNPGAPPLPLRSILQISVDPAPVGARRRARLAMEEMNEFSQRSSKATVPTIATGRVSCTLTVQSTDPLSNAISLIDQINTVTGEIYNNVMLGGPIYSRMVQVANSLGALSQRLSDCASSLGSPADIATVSNTLADIKTVLRMQD